MQLVKIPMAAAGPRISVVVAAFDAEATIVACVDSILDQSLAPFELIVVDDGSTDATAERLEGHPRRDRFELLRLQNGGPSRARNHGVARARGELVAFFDADCAADRDCLARLAEGFRGEDASKVASVGGRQLPPAGESPFGLEVHRYFQAIGFLTGYLQKGAAGEVVDTAHNPSCVVLYRRGVFERLGGFDESLWPGEDVDLDERARRAGYRHRFHPDAVIYHHRPASLDAFRRMMSSYGRAQAILLRRWGPFRTLHYLPIVALMMAALAAGGLWLWPLPSLLGLVLGAALVLGVLEGLRRGVGQGWVFYRLLAANLGGWTAGFLRELLRPTRRGPAAPTS